MEDLFPLIMKPPVFVDELIVDAETEMIFGKTKDIRKMAKERFNKYSIQKQAEEIRNYFNNQLILKHYGERNKMSV